MRRWRKMTWVLIVWTIASIAWIAGGIAQISESFEEKCRSNPLPTLCEAVEKRSAEEALLVILAITFGVFVMLSLIWFMSRPKRRECPVCGNDVKRGLTTCPSCGHDFAAATAARAG